MAYHKCGSVYVTDKSNVVLNTVSNSIANFNTQLALPFTSGIFELPYRKNGYNKININRSTGSTVVRDKVPYLFRTSGGSIDIGESETDSLVGASYPFNQLVQKSGAVYSSMSGTKTYDSNTNTVTFFAKATNGRLSFLQEQSDNHKYYVCGYVKSSVSGTMQIECSKGWNFFLTSLTANTKTLASGILPAGSSADSSKRFNFFVRGEPTYTLELSDLQTIDLTTFFGSSTIADYVYNLEQGTAGAGVAWLKAYAPKIFGKYNAYNAGTLMSVKTSKHITTGFNAYDNSTGKAKVVGGNQYQITGTYTSLTLDGETITPNASGIFTPDMSGEITVVGGNATDTCIHLVWDGERNGEYEPYVKHEYDYSGEREVTRYFGIVDLGTLDWVYDSELSVFYSTSIVSLVKEPEHYKTPYRCSKYTPYPSDSRTALSNSGTDKSFMITSSGQKKAIVVKDATYSDAQTFKTAMSGVYLIYELATPYTETVSNPELRGIPKLDANNKLYYYGDTCSDLPNPQAVDDFGTEEYVDNREVAIPVGHDTFYSDGLTIATKSFGQTIYGGEFNSVTGELTSSYNADGTQKQTPDIIQLTPLELLSFIGNNNVWSDTNGNSSIKYKRIAT